MVEWSDRYEKPAVGLLSSVVECSRESEPGDELKGQEDTSSVLMQQTPVEKDRGGWLSGEKRLASLWYDMV